VDPELEKLVIKLIQENPTWGSNRIVGALDNLGFTMSDSTVDNICHRNGFDSAPVRRKNTTWRRFLQAHWQTLIAADFFTTEVLSWNGLIPFYTLFVIDLRSRSVHACGTTVSPRGAGTGARTRRIIHRQLPDMRCILLHRSEALITVGMKEVAEAGIPIHSEMTRHLERF